MFQLQKESVEEQSPFTPDQIALVHSSPLPEHIAIIMDGNRRWAKKKNLPAFAGHIEGVQALMRAVKGAVHLGIKTLTVFGFSTENWQRTSEEVKSLLELLQVSSREQQKGMLNAGIRLHVIGDLSRFPSALVSSLQGTVKATSQGSKIDLIVALNYGGRDDIRRGIIRLLGDVEKGKVSSSELTESLLSKYLDTAAWPDPELLIRTSGEMRLSNFLLWQISYSEIVVTETLWPDFSEEVLLKAILEFQRRERRLGGGG